MFFKKLRGILAIFNGIRESDGNREALEVALLFYSYLNEKTDDFLAEHDFSRREIQEDLRDIVSRYGLGDLAGVFLTDSLDS